MDRPLQVVAFAASKREGSLNRRLLDLAVDALDATGEADIDVVDLRRYPLPLYDADEHARDGVPKAVQALHDRIAAADAVLVASPEYNGGYPALLKNLIDWVSRLDMLLFHPRYVGLLAATPGKGGGRRGLEHLAALFANIFVTTHGELFTVAGANEALTETGWEDDADGDRLRAWTAAFVTAALAHRAARDAA